MKRYFIDTNVLLRFLLHDHDKFYQQALGYLEEAKQGSIELVLIPEVVFEMDYVLRGVYKLSKSEVCDLILKLVKSSYFNIDYRSVMISSLEKCLELNIDLFDIYLHYLALYKKGKVLSFDRDFEKLKK